MSDFFREMHMHSSKNRSEIENSRFCRCLCCLVEFSKKSIKEWTDNDQTAICPKCGVDSVIGDKFIDDLFEQVNLQYFGTKKF